jgi:hypothetical protein
MGSLKSLMEIVMKETLMDIIILTKESLKKLMVIDMKVNFVMGNMMEEVLSTF